MLGGLFAFLPGNVQQALAVICYSCLVIGAGWFLAIGSRRPAPSERREAFRKPARVRALGYLLVAADGIFILTESGSATWEVVLSFGWLVLGLLVTWVGHRAYSRAADAYPPGKHAGTAGPRESRWLRRR